MFLEEIIRFCKSFEEKLKKENGYMSEERRPAPPGGRQWQTHCQFCTDNGVSCSDCDRDGWLLLQSYEVEGCVITPPSDNIRLNKDGFDLKPLPGWNEAVDHAKFRVKCRHCMATDITLAITAGTHEVPPNTFTRQLEFDRLYDDTNSKVRGNKSYGIGVYTDADSDEAVRVLFEADFVQQGLGSSEEYQERLPEMITNLSFILFDQKINGSGGITKEKYDNLLSEMTILQQEARSAADEMSTVFSYAEDAKDAASNAFDEARSAYDEADSGYAKARQVASKADELLQQLREDSE